MEHEEFVEAPVFDAPPLALDVPVLDVDLGGLAEACELLVGRLRRHDAGPVRSEIVQPHGISAGIDRVEFHEPGPGLVEQNIVAEMSDFLDDHAGVVNGAVVGALFDDGDPEWPLAPPGLLVGDQRMVADLFPDERLVERFVKDRADQAMGIAVGLEIDGNAAADEQGAVMCCLVVVAVEQHEVALGHERRQHDLVRRRGAVQHEIGLLGAEDRGGFLLCLERRTFVNQQVAEFEH